MRLGRHQAGRRERVISIHAPREGCDATDDTTNTLIVQFQSTHPVRGATTSWALTWLRTVISIHAPREGCDLYYSYVDKWFHVFQSTHPVRGATRSSSVNPSWHLFQSTHPVRGATCTVEPQYKFSFLFQSTHPVRGATSCAIPSGMESDSNPRTPRGVRLARDAKTGELSIFQSTHPARGATCGGSSRYVEHVISIHAPREGCDAGRWLGESDKQAFQSTHPARGATRQRR